MVQDAAVPNRVAQHPAQPTFQESRHLAPFQRQPYCLGGTTMRAFIAILSLCLVGCHRDPHSSVYTKTQPKLDDLVGVYVPDQTTVSLITREGHYRELPASITLGTGGALSITNIPDWWGTDQGMAKGGFDSGRGTWKVVQHREWWAISAYFESAAQFASTQNRAKDLYTSFRLVGEGPPYKILLLVGSPDDGRAMQFERVQPRNK